MRENLHRICLADFSDLSHLDREKLFNATVLSESGKAYRSQTRTLYSALRPFGRFILNEGVCSFPTTRQEWQSILLRFQSYYLRDPESNAIFSSRCRTWDDSVVLWLRGLTAESVIPRGVQYPRCDLPEPVVDPGSPSRPKLLGDRAADYTPISAPINKTLAGPIFWRSEVEYLDEVEENLRARNNIVRDVLDDYWLRLTKDYRTGKNQMRKISPIEFQRRMAESDWNSDLVRPKIGQYGGDLAPLTHPDVPNNLGWALVIAKNELKISNDTECLSRRKLGAHPAMLWNFFHKGKSTLNLTAYTALRAEQSARLEERLLFLRLLGVLSNVDLAVAVAILIQEHPNFTPEALISARLINSRGRSGLLVADGGRSRIFSVDKPRAGSRKYALLTPRAATVMRHVVRATSGIRNMLRRCGSKFWRHLFLGCAGGPATKSGIVQIAARQLNNRESYSLATLYPELAQAGVDSSFDFAKLRATQGVLEWFATGSIAKASKRLGNSYRVCLENYIPAPLLSLWNERIIRNFQNVLIVLAASSEDYLLDVSDFQSIEELHKFLLRIVVEYPATVSPVGKLIQQRFGKYKFQEYGLAVDDQSGVQQSLLTLRLDENSLAVLMAFQAWAPSNMSSSELETLEATTGLSPRAFIDLAEFLNRAALSEDVGEALRESLMLSRLKVVHQAAQLRIPNVIERFKSMRIRATWDVVHA